MSDSSSLDPSRLTEHSTLNRNSWNTDSDLYQSDHAEHLGSHISLDCKNDVCVQGIDSPNCIDFSPGLPHLLVKHIHSHSRGCMELFHGHVKNAFFALCVHFSCLYTKDEQKSLMNRLWRFLMICSR